MARFFRRGDEDAVCFGDEPGAFAGDGVSVLSAAGSGRMVRVVQLNGGGRLRAKLAAMGISPGALLTVRCNSGGPVIIEVKGSRVSLGRGMAQKIMVNNAGIEEKPGGTPIPRNPHRSAEVSEENLSLDQLGIGECGEIVKVGAVGEIKKRLLEMGVVPGAKFVIERLAPLGDPIEVLIMGYHLSLRHTEAGQIRVKRVGK